MIRPATALRTGKVAVLAALAATAQAATVMNEFIPIDDTTFVPCVNGGVGEVADIQGTTHVVVIDEVVGSMRTARFFFNGQGVFAVGQTTGTRYVVVGKGSSVMKTSVLHENLTATFTETLSFIGPGAGDKFFSQAQFHITVRPDGSVVMSRDSERVTCKEG